MQVVATAKVPIVKLVVMPYGLKFDLSIGMGNGVDAVEYIRSALVDWPPLRPMVTVLKLFLLQRQMNEVFTGGLSSFSLILSVLAFLKMHQSRQSKHRRATLTASVAPGIGPSVLGGANAHRVALVSLPAPIALLFHTVTCRALCSKPVVHVNVHGPLSCSLCPVACPTVLHQFLP